MSYVIQNGILQYLQLLHMCFTSVSHSLFSFTWALAIGKSLAHFYILIVPVLCYLLEQWYSYSIYNDMDCVPEL